MRQRTLLTIALLIATLFASQAAMAVITFNQLTDDIFVVSHRVKILGSRGKAMKLVYEKAASLCVAAGYSYFEILDQESEAAQEDDAANASVRIKLFDLDGPDRIGCEENASLEYVAQAEEKLARNGYSRPEPSELEQKAASGGSTCTVEQILAMVEAGLSNDQVKAACPDGD